MQGMRTLLRNSLARSLRKLSEEDRLAAAMPVVCGSALAAHCTVTGLDEQRILHLGVSSGDWLEPLLGMRDVLARDLAQTAGVALHGLDLQVIRPPRSRAAASGPRPGPAAGGPGLPRPARKGNFGGR